MNDKTNAGRVALHKANLRRAGGRVMSVALDPEAVTAAEYLVQTGWANSLTAALNRAVLTIGNAQRVALKGESRGNRN